MLDEGGRPLAEEDWLSRLAVGRRVGLYYAEADKLWHERMLIYPVDGESAEWYVLTPDGDIYIENVAAKDEDGCVRAFLCGLNKERPALATGKFYRFAEWPGSAVLKQHVRDARALVMASEFDAVDPEKMISALGTEVDFFTYIGVPRRARGSALVPLGTPRRPRHAAISIGTPQEEDGEPLVGESAAPDDGHEWLAMESAFGIEIHTAILTSWGNRSLSPAAPGVGCRPRLHRWCAVRAPHAPCSLSPAAPGVGCRPWVHRWCPVRPPLAALLFESGSPWGGLPATASQVVRRASTSSSLQTALLSSPAAPGAGCRPRVHRWCPVRSVQQLRRWCGLACHSRSGLAWERYCRPAPPRTY